MKVVVILAQLALVVALMVNIVSLREGIENFVQNQKELTERVERLEQALRETSERLVFPPIKDRKLRDVREEVKDSIFLVSHEYGSGTGFQIMVRDKKYVISNAHVCKGNEEVDLTDTGTGEKFKRKVLKTDPDIDLCLIEGVDERRALPLGKYLSVGETVAAVGHPHGWDLVMTEGEAFNLKDTPEVRDETVLCFGKNLRLIFVKDEEKFICLRKHTDTISTTVVVLPGSSGSPLLNIKGQVVGVVYMYNTEGADWGSAIPLAHLREFIKDVR